MRLIGLTGGIASGKSAVAHMLRELGAVVLDADAIYHRLIAPQDGQASPLSQRIAARFAGVLKDDGNLDRAELGAQVFADPEKRAQLNAMAHPAVAEEVGRESAALAARGVSLVIYDVPLLFERGLEVGMAGVIVVWAPRDTQLQRLIARDGLTREQAEARLNAQMSLDEKRRRATWVIDNSGDVAATRRQVAALWQTLQSP